MRKVGGERAFYDTVETKAVELALQKPENQYAPLVARLRESDPSPSDKPLIDAFVTHLIGRASSTRQSAINTIGAMADASEQVLTTGEYLQEKVLAAMRENPELQAFFTLHPEARHLLGPFTRAFVEKFGPEAAAKLFGAVRNQDMREMARTGQGSAILREPPATMERVALLPLTWAVRRQQSRSYILGDIVGVAQFSDADDLVPIFRPAGPLTALFLPISSTALLTGSTREARAVDDETVNMASAELSHEFFVSATNTEREQAYFARLRKRAVDSSLASELARTTLDEWRRGKSSEPGTSRTPGQ